jgi:hypothetical protein
MTEGETRQRPEGDSATERREQRDILLTERSVLVKVAQAVKLADFMAILMVLATFFSAYATWRTAKVTSTIFAVADRPFLGVQQVSFEATDSEHPMLAVQFRNFGSIPALNAIVGAHAVIDGRLVKDPEYPMAETDAGILSPNVPHTFHLTLARDQYQAVVAGKSNLQVHVRMLYKGPAHDQELCYFERFAYDFRSGIFGASGGDDRCRSDIF